MKNLVVDKHVILLISILIFAAFLRLYKIENCHFGADQAGEAFTVKRLIENREVPLLGERCGSCSKEVHFLGPSYYYLLTIPYLLFNYHPCSGAFFTACLGIVSVLLCYKIGELMFNKNVGLLSAFFMAFTPFIVHVSRYQWSVNILPFFVFTCLYSLLNIKRGKQNYWFLFSFSLAILLQLHFSNFFFIPAIFIFFLIFKPKINKRKMLKSFIIIPILFIPTLIHELYSNFENSTSIINFFLSNLLNFGFNFGMLEKFFVSLFYWGLNNVIFSAAIFIFYFLYSFYLIKKVNHKEIIFLILWILITLSILISNVSLRASPFNFEVIFPATFLLMGSSFYELFKIRNKVISLFLLVLISSELIIHSLLIINIITRENVKNEISAVKFIIENTTEEIPKVSFDRHCIGNGDEKPFLYLFEYYGKNVTIEDENFNYLIVCSNRNETLLNEYLNKTKFRIDFGEVSVIKLNS